MRKSLYAISMVVYTASIIVAFLDVPLVYMGYWFIASFFGSEDYGMILSTLLALVSMVFHTLAVFKSKKYIYVTRGILFLGCLFNLLMLTISRGDMLLSFILSVALLVMTFIEKTEYIITNTVSEEELAAIEKENADEKTNGAIGNIVAFVVLPIALTIFIFAGTLPFYNIEVKKLAEEYRADLPSNLATDEQFAQYEENAYLELADSWQVDEKLATARLDTSFTTDDYWLINDNVNILYHLYYDSWDGAAESEILINVNYGYPNVKTDKIAKICIGDEYDYDTQNPETYFCPDFTDEEKEILRDFILNEKYLEQEKTTVTREQYYNVDRQDVFWYFEGEDTLYLVQGNICKLEDGKYYLHEGMFSYDFYALPDTISQKLLKSEK